MPANPDIPAIIEQGKKLEAIIEASKNDRMEFPNSTVRWLAHELKSARAKIERVEARVEVYERLRPVKGRRNTVIARHLVIQEIRAALRGETDKEGGE